VQYPQAAPSVAQGERERDLYAISTARGQPIGLSQAGKGAHSQTGTALDSHLLFGGGKQLQICEQDLLPRQGKSSGSSQGEPLIAS